MNPISRRHFVSTATAGAIAPIISAQAAPDPIKIGQIGSGHAHASGKMDVYRKSADFDVIGLAEPDASRAPGKSYDDLPRMSVEQLLNAPGVRAIAIETEVKDLLKYAEMAIDAGKHIHLDKPAGSNFEHYQRIMKKADAAGLTVQMGFMYRYNPAVQFLRNALDEGWLGTPFEVHTVMSKVMNPSSRAGLKEQPGGTMFELGCHIIDLTVGFLGKPDAVRPYPRQVIEDGLIDNMLAVFEYPKATATVRSSAVEVEGFSRRLFTLCGTEGTCHIQPLDRPSIRLSLSKAQGKHPKGVSEIKFDPPYKRYVGDAIDFAAIIREEKSSDYPSSHDLTVQESVLLASSIDPQLKGGVASGRF